MTFFVTNAGSGASGGDLGGLAGADSRCQQLAAAVGRGNKTWRAYLSTAPFMGVGTLVHARDRIGAGPWLNHAGVVIAASVPALHASPPSLSLMLTETGATVPTNEHDILTGSKSDGTAHETFPSNPGAPGPNCGNWTSNSTSDYAWAGHADWDNGTTNPSWNSAHETQCDPAGLMATAGSGRIYCFAIN